MALPAQFSHLSKRYAWQIYSGFMIAVAAIYFGSLSELMLDVDDARTFRDNVAVAQNFTYLFFAEKEVGSGRLNSDFTRFVAYLLVGNQPGPMHLFVVAVHTLASLLLARLTFRLGVPLPISLLAGLLFLVNVAQFRAVHWIAALDYPLALVWGCLTLLAYLHYRDRPHPLKLALFYLCLLLSLLTHLVIAFVLPFYLYLLWRQGQQLRDTLRHFAGPVLLAPLLLYGVLSTTAKATTTQWSIEHYATEGGVELLLGCGRMFLWLLSRMVTTAYWLPIPLYERQEWELYVGAIFLILLMGLLWKRVFPLDVWGLWILMALVPFALLTEKTVGNLLPGPSRYLYLATAGWAVALSWSLVEPGKWVARHRKVKSTYVLAAVLAPLLLSSYISLNKIEALSFYTSGRNYIADEKTDEGVAQMHRALDHAPEVLNLNDVYPRLCLILINKPDQFERAITEALTALPYNTQLNLYMYAFKSMAADSLSQKQALDYLARGKRYAAAQSAVNVSMALATAFNNMGRGFQAAHNHQQAVTAYRYSLQHLPDRFNTLFNLAYTLFDQDKVQEASETLQRATQIKARDPKAMYLRALILQREGKIEEALALSQQAMRIKPLIELFYLASFCYNLLGQYDQAAAILERGIRRNDKMPNLATYKRLADYYSKSGRRGDAINVYNTALQMDPRDAEARTNLGWLLFLDGQVEEAIAHTRRVLQGGSPAAHAMFNLGLFHLSRGEVEQAKTAYARAVEQFGAALGEQIGAVHNLKNLANKGIQVEAAGGILKVHWGR